MMADFKEKFFDISSLIQSEFDRNLELYGEKIQCRRGCSKCCSQIFRITQLDGWMIGEHIRSLPKERRAELKKKAREYIEALPFAKGEYPQDEGVMDSDHPGSSSHPSLIKEGSYSADNPSNGLPCPALGSEGECTIYEARPVICRRFGMPIYDYKNPDNVHACDLNFSDGDEITDTELIPNQTIIGRKWDELKDEFIESLDTSDKFNKVYTTIADAIAEA
jgi:Fe-S-cluster containining protein